MTPRIDLIGIIVSDMTTSLAFYRALGLDIPAELDHEAHAEITLPSGLRIAWDTVDVIRSFDPAFALPGDGPRGTSVAFLCDGPAEVDAAYADLTSAGHRSHLEPWDAFWGQRYASVLDPDGNQVDLFAPLR